MPTDHWVNLLSRAPAPGGLVDIAHSLGFQRPASVDADTARAIGLNELGELAIAAGPGTARMLLTVSDHPVPAREEARDLARRLGARAPHLHWLLAVANRRHNELIVAAWRGGRSGPQVTALVVDCGNVLASDVETMAALVDSMDAGELVIHARWTEILGREAISRAFFVTLERLVNRLADNAVGRASPDDRRELALLSVSRLLFLSFLEAREWLDSDMRFLSRSYDDCIASGGCYQRRVLEPLFFGTLNTPVAKRAPAARALGRIPFLNGGLFTRASVESCCRNVVLQDDDWGALHDELLLRYRFTAREETGEWREAAIDPEILGRAFESLMAAEERKVSGAFYTPQHLVERTTESALEALLTGQGLPEGTLSRVLENVPLDDDSKDRLARALTGLRLLDPACGSGAFLLHALDRLTRLRQAAGDERPAVRIRRETVARSIFGVDVNPTAVWLCELRLWLALLIDHPRGDPAGVPPLPNLDHNIRCGDALSGGDFAVGADPVPGRDASRLRIRYARATGARKRSLGRELDRLERRQLIAWYDQRLAAAADRRRALLAMARGRDLFGARRGVAGTEAMALRQERAQVRELRRERKRVTGGGALPFAFPSRFPDVAANGGFDIVVGNPPWIRVHHIPLAERERWRREFRVFREAAWSSGSRSAGVTTGFASQVDVASLFVERGLGLLRSGGVLSLLVPAKLWRSLAGGGVRRLLSADARLLALEDWSEAPPSFPAATYPSLVTAMRPAVLPAPDDDSCRLAVHRGRVQVVWRGDRVSLPLDATPGAPWIPLPPEARVAFDRLMRAGIPLADAGAGRVTLGVKSGCNDAFLVRLTSVPDEMVEATDGKRRLRLPSACLRPVLRGESVQPWRAPVLPDHILFPHGDDGRLLRPLPPEVRAWLLPWRSRLQSRSDARSTSAWWSLFRLDGASPHRPRVVWADIGRSLQALVLPAGDRTVPLNTCYVLPVRDMDDAFTLAALFNSPLADAWLGAVCEPARGGYRRHFAWAMARLPVPDDWVRARAILAPLGARGMQGDAVGRAELLDGALAAYRIRRARMTPLLEWMG